MVIGFAQIFLQYFHTDSGILNDLKVHPTFIYFSNFILFNKYLLSTKYVSNFLLDIVDEIEIITGKVY